MRRAVVTGAIETTRPCPRVDRAAPGELVDWRLPRSGETLREIEPLMIGLTPELTAVAVVNHGVLRLNFADGLAGKVDVLARMGGPVFEEAREPKGFAQAALDHDSGTVTWPGGADLAPDTLYERVRTRTWPDTTARRIGAVDPTRRGVGAADVHRL